MSGVNKEVKDTIDLMLNNNDAKWSGICSFLYKELSKNIKEYFNSLQHDNYKPENNDNNHFNLFNRQNLHIDSFMVQKYTQGEGKYVYHIDFHVDFERNRHRVITYVWYLNDVTVGGETEFWGDFKIIPEKGKLLLFPAVWCFPHRGKACISSNKYIITGWFYI